VNHRSCLAIALVAILLAASGCGAGQRVTRDPNTLIVLELADATTLNPLFSSNYYSAVYESLIFDGLVNIGSDYQPIPDLATSWTATPDGLHWTVELRRGVRWSDGTPFDARDVTWTYAAMLSPDTGFPYRGQFAYIRSVRADGAYRVRFDLAQPNALFVLEALNAPILPRHILGGIAFKGQQASTFGEHPVGTGPYALREWRHDEQLTLTRNPHFWAGPAAIATVAFRVVLDDQARTDAMQRGEADVDDGMGASAFQILKEGHAKLQLLHVPDLYSEFVYVNFARPGLEDVRVRRAMMYGWDRVREIAGLTHNDADPALGIIPVALRYWYDPHVRVYPYDPARARASLDAAGYRAGADGVRRRGKVRLEYTLSFPGNGQASFALQIATVFQADMRAIGIAIDLQQIDYATFLTQTQNEQFDLAISGWGGTPDPDQETLLASDQFPPAGNNLMHYHSPRMDRDLRVGLATIDPAKRKPYYDDMQRLIAEDVPVLYYEFPFSRTAISPRVKLDVTHALPDQYLFLSLGRWRLVR
jgi:peptide/nickel transport system substrate-binding protein